MNGVEYVFQEFILRAFSQGACAHKVVLLLGKRLMTQHLPPAVQSMQAQQGVPTSGNAE